jgi:aryl-alcohol dehydrogenase-like predicted oxidoreductase
MTNLSLKTEPVALGKSGLAVFPIAWGMWRLASPDGKDDLGAIADRVEAALEAGVTLFDTADIYGCDAPIGFGGAEALFGKALAANPHWRERMVIATKGGIWLGKPYDRRWTICAARSTPRSNGWGCRPSISTRSIAATSSPIRVKWPRL